ncbi:MAG: hypothetical protein O7D30_11305, partial [Rickettsia endosymbiont of Ixodes persulcatus]|nr:hypothetical protein [Rickettsia endosymbiont of Ixodes persulcatus]
REHAVTLCLFRCLIGPSAHNIKHRKKRNVMACSLRLIGLVGGRARTGETANTGWSYQLQRTHHDVVPHSLFHLPFGT